MKRSITSVLIFFFILGFSIFEFSAVAAEENSKPFKVEVKNQTISIEAKDASALEVLNSLGDKAGIEVRVYEGVEDKTINLNVEKYPLGEMMRLLKRFGFNFVYGYEVKQSDNVLYILPRGKEGEVLAASGKAAPAMTLRNGKIYRIKMIGDRIRILEENSGDRFNRLDPDLIEFLDGEGNVIRTVSFFPEGIARKVRHKIFSSPAKIHMATISSYTLPDGTTPEGKPKVRWERRLTLYDPSGNILWEEVWDKEKEFYKSDGLFLYPRDDGTTVMIWPKEAEFERRGADGVTLKKDQVSSWVNTYYSAEFPGPPNVDERTLPNWRFALDASERYLCQIRTSAFQHEVYLIDLDSGEILWKHEKNKNISATTGGVFPDHQVVLVKEYVTNDLGKTLDSYQIAYNLEGKEVWRLNEPPTAMASPGDERTLRLDYYKGVLNPKTSMLEPMLTGWKVIDAKTGKVLEMGVAP
jgi:hypothetical protein